jgi:DNA invertase Pin-like site-specific DNA recombinase
MQSTYAAPLARLGPLVMALVVLGLLVMPVSANAARAHARDTVAVASAGWHGRAVQNPHPRPRLADARWPQGWSAGPVGLGTGYHRPGGSDRVRDVQRRLRQLGYRPGPVDGLFGPRTQAATRWFQFKHGLTTSGQVTRSTLAVLRARSEHKPVRTITRRIADPSTKTLAPRKPPEPGPGATDGASITWILAGVLVLLAVALGVVTSLLIPEVRRTWRPAETPPVAALPRPAPVPAPRRERRPADRTAPRVLGYATVEGNGQEAESTTAALALRCAHRGWSLVEVVHDHRESGRSLAQRPGLAYALDTIRSGAAAGLVVARLGDVGSRIADLATLLRWLEEANAFLGAADHDLDTSTRAGRGTATAIVELGHWQRQWITARTREDLARGRFTPAREPTTADLAQQIAAMHDRGLSMRAIADALNLAGIPGPARHARWRPADVKAAKETSRS